MAIGYGIFSGGLDSMISALVLREQGVEVRLLTFSTPFFGPEKALESGRSIGLKPRVVDLTEAHLAMMENPRHGYGRYMNPCIDCHALMFNRAGRIMEAEGGDFLFSGEVLGQRPKSQNPRAMALVARESGFADRILRPLSARLLPVTAMERDGLVDRSRLPAFSGRTRKPQMEWAAARGLADYPSPAGGCLLTDPAYSRRLKELADRGWPLDVRETRLLKWGRHFRLPGGARLVVGRNQAENEALEPLVSAEDTIFRVLDVPGPMVMMVNGGAADRGLAASMAVSYSDAPDFEPRSVKVFGAGVEETVQAEGRPKQEFAGMMI